MEAKERAMTTMKIQIISHWLEIKFPPNTDDERREFAILSENG